MCFVANYTQGLVAACLAVTVRNEIDLNPLGGPHYDRGRSHWEGLDYGKGEGQELESD